jgi:hypothetical protein
VTEPVARLAAALTQPQGWGTGQGRVSYAAQERQNAAGVPILTVAFDFSRRVTDLGTLYRPTGDEVSDLKTIRGRYHKGMARHPEAYGE